MPTLEQLRDIDWEHSSFTLERARTILGVIDWQHEDREFTDDESLAIAYATYLYGIGQLSGEEFGKLLGGIDPWIMKFARLGRSSDV